MTRIAAALHGNLQRYMEQEIKDATGGVIEGIKQTSDHLKGRLRSQVIASGLGRRLSNTWRNRFYKNREIDAAALVWSNAPTIIDAHDRGVTIRTRNGGKYLAIPTEFAKKQFPVGRNRIGRFQKRGISPKNWNESRNGKLVFIKNKNGRGGLLVARKTLKRRGNRTVKIGKRHVRSQVAFILVPQVSLKKRLNFDREAARATDVLVRNIQKEYRTSPVPVG